MSHLDTTEQGFDPRWKARLNVQVIATPFGSRLGDRMHTGPLRIQRPFFPEGPQVPHIYLLHPPGGVVGGDCLEIRFGVGESAHAVVTTPAAQKLYRSAALRSQLSSELVLESNACAEWLPMETIVFDGAQSHSHSIIRLGEHSRYIGWEIVCFGRPASGNPFASGRYSSCLELHREGHVLLIENTRVQGSSDVLSTPWGYAGYPVSATWLCVAPEAHGPEGIMRQLRDSLPVCAELRAAITELDGAVVLRIQSKSVEVARRVLIESWARTRPLVMGRPACEPRIWQT